MRARLSVSERSMYPASSSKQPFVLNELGAGEAGWTSLDLAELSLIKLICGATQRLACSQVRLARLPSARTRAGSPRDGCTVFLPGSGPQVPALSMGRAFSPQSTPFIGGTRTLDLLCFSDASFSEDLSLVCGCLL